VQKLRGDADLPRGELIIRGEDVVHLLLPPGGERVLFDAGVFARRAQRPNHQPLHHTQPVNHRVGDADLINLVAGARADRLERQDGDRFLTALA
jgi:hypothetical protein